MTFSDNDNPISSTAAAPAHESDSQKKTEENTTAGEAAPVSEQTAAPVEQAAAPAEPVKADEAHAAAEAANKTANADA